LGATDEINEGGDTWWCPMANEYIPPGLCKYVDTCEDPDLQCYGSMCDTCVKTCKVKNFSIVACNNYVGRDGVDEKP